MNWLTKITEDRLPVQRYRYSLLTARQDFSGSFVGPIPVRYALRRLLRLVSGHCLNWLNNPSGLASASSSLHVNRNGSVLSDTRFLYGTTV